VKRILFACGQGGIGDALCGVTVLRALRRLNLGSEFGYVSYYPEVCPSWARAYSIVDVGGGANNGAFAAAAPKARGDWLKRLDGFAGLSAPRAVITGGNDRRFIRHVPPPPPGYDQVISSTIWDAEYTETGWRVGWVPLPIFLGRVPGLGIEVTAEDCHDVLEITDEDRARAAEIAGEEPYAVTMSGPGRSAYWVWPPETRAPVIAYLRGRGLRVFGLAAKGTAPLDGTIPCHGLPVRVSAALIEGARVYVGMDSGPSWFAVLCTSTPSVIVTRKEMARAGEFNLFGDARVWNITNDRPDSERIALVEQILAE